MDKEQETKLSLLMRAMIKYDGGDEQTERTYFAHHQP